MRLNLKNHFLKHVENEAHSLENHLLFPTLISFHPTSLHTSPTLAPQIIFYLSVHQESGLKTFIGPQCCLESLSKQIKEAN